MISESLVRLAHADAWQCEGELRIPFGGGITTVRGARLMASGIDRPQWNGGDIDDPVHADVDAMREWYAARAAPWGVRVPAGAEWPHGRFLFRQRLMGRALDGFGRQYGDIPTGGQNRVVIRRAGSDDVDAVVHVDSIGFDVEPDVGRLWIEPHLHSARVEVALAELDGDPVGTAYALRSDGPAGPALYLAGVTVVPDARRRGIAGAISAWLVGRGEAAGARIAHLHPDNDEAARVDARLGFVEVNGLDIYVDL